MKCNWYLCDNELTGKQRKFCSKSCSVKFYVKKHRKEMKLKAVEYKGSKCLYCGYDKSIAALQFHHRDPDQKDFQLSNGDTRSWEKYKNELDKCDLVCANCHAELHSGIAQLVDASGC